MVSALEKAMELERAGKSDSEIISEMKEIGFGAREINEALNEVKIKKTITEKPISGIVDDSEMEPSIIEKPVEQEIEVPLPSQKRPQESIEQAPYSYQPESVPYSYQQAQAYQQPQYYTDQQQQQTIDVDLIEEISEEIVNEKFNEFNSRIGDIPSFKQAIEKRIESVEERLKRVENNLDKIQISLIGKIKEYGESVKTLSNEIQTVEDSFSKIINPLISNIKELGNITERLRERVVNKKSEKNVIKKTKESKR